MQLYQHGGQFFSRQRCRDKRSTRTSKNGWILETHWFYNHDFVFCFFWFDPFRKNAGFRWLWSTRRFKLHTRTVCLCVLDGTAQLIWVSYGMLMKLGVLIALSCYGSARANRWLLWHTRQRSDIRCDDSRGIAHLKFAIFFTPCPHVLRTKYLVRITGPVAPSKTTFCSCFFTFLSIKITKYIM